MHLILPGHELGLLRNLPEMMNEIILIISEFTRVQLRVFHQANKWNRQIKRIRCKIHPGEIIRF